MDGRDLRYGFLNNHHVLVSRLSTKSILPHVYARGLISQSEKGVIQNQVTDDQKTDKLLDIIHRQGNSNQSVYSDFFKLLSDEDVMAGQHLDDVVENIKKDSLSDDVKRKFQYKRRLLEENDSMALKNHKWAIIQSLSVDEVLPELIALGVVSSWEKVDIKSESTPNQQAVKLYNIIQDRGSRAFDGFVKVLLASDRLRHFGEMLRGSDTSNPYVTSDKFPVEEVLKRGHIPPRQGVYVERTEMIKKIRSALYNLKDKEGWVLVHGIAGFGKTVLAAEAVRDATILEEVFPGGVNWLTVGKMSDHNGDVDRVKLLSKLQDIILRLDRSNSNRQLTSVESAKDYLQEVIAEQHPRSLLILDDVWSYEVINAFSVRCRLLVTTRVSALISPVMVKNVNSVSVSEGFSDDEGKKLLALWLGKSPDDLPSHSDTILKYCRGSPMAISLIGAMLRRNSDLERWEAIADRMEKKHFHLDTKIKNWGYEHPTLNASIELSVESIPEESKEYFEMLAVFDYDSSFPIKALETIWDVDEFEAEEHINVISDLSLANKCVTVKNETSSQARYTIHDIILDYLKGNTSDEKQRELHKLVVERYDNKCKGAFATLKDDDYVYQKLLGHIIASGNLELLGSLLTQLKWLLSNVEYGDANMLLSQYREYKTKVPQNFQECVKKFELFMSGHMYILAHNPKREDILQLALLQPDESEIYMQASAIVKGEKRKSWFKWSNKDSDPEKYALKLKLHNEGVNSCQYSEDGEKVLSCAGTEVKLWDSSTGTVLGNFRGHKDRVTNCVMTTNGRYIVSSSEDNTVKVWETRTRRLVCDFDKHQYGVQCCDVSPDSKWVVSADIDSVIILWDMLLGKVQNTWRLGMFSPALTPTAENINEPLDFSNARSISSESSGCSGEGVLCCNFSPDGTQFVTASQNGNIRLWNLSSSSVILCFHGHSSQVRGCIFSKSGSQLASASLDHYAKVWDATSGECTADLDHGEEAVMCCDFSQDASKLITGDTGGNVKVWSLPHGLLLQDLPQHWDYVNCVLFSPKTQNILSAADNGIIKILWNEEREEASSHMISAVQYHRRFSTHFAKEGSKYEPMVLCHIHKEKKLKLVKGAKAEVLDLCLPTFNDSNLRSWIFSNTGDKIAVGYVQGTLQVIQVKKEGGKWSAQTSWRVYCAHNYEVLKCFFSPDDSKVASCCHKEHKIWDAATGRHIATIAGRGVGVKPCVFLDDSVKIVSIQESCVLLWNSSTGSSIATLDYGKKGDTILCVNLSKDNRRIIASATSGLVLVWSVSGDLLMKSTVMPLSACARSCALSPDGSLAVAGFDDGSMKIWNVSKKMEVTQQFTGSLYWMIDVSFSPDGSQIVTLCDSIEWWKPDGTHIKRVLLKGTFGKYIRFSPDFRTFVTIDNAGLLYILTAVE